MSRLDDYRSAMLAAFADISDAELNSTIDDYGPTFPYFVVDYGLGPMWHERTERDEFRASRRAAEALYLAQLRTLEEIDVLLNAAGVEYAVIKGAANRLLLYENPAVRACHDIDLLVRAEDKVKAAMAFVGAGFEARLDPNSISRELIVSKSFVDIDLHWGLLREGRLRHDPGNDMINRRRRENGLWMLSAEDTLFLLLVHPAFAKNLEGWEMGLHRVVDIVAWLTTQSFNWESVREQLESNGVRTAAWATLRWVELLTGTRVPTELNAMLADLRPGTLRRAWLDRWLRDDLSERTSDWHWTRLIGFSLFLHDAPGDGLRALIERYRAHRRRDADLWVFRELLGE